MPVDVANAVAINRSVAEVSEYAANPDNAPLWCLPGLTYPFHGQTILVTRCGRICCKGRKVNFSHVFAGQRVGVTQVGEHIWLVTFMHYDLGYFDDETCRLEPIENPFGPKGLPLRSE